MSADFGHVPLVVATRGGAVECVHYGSIAVVTEAGTVVARAGNPDFLTFTRSSCKPFQAVPLIAHPGFPALGLQDPEIAVMCASHSGEPRHIDAVVRILDRIGCTRRDLQCGVHPPLYFETFERRAAAEDVFTALHHNCSGKHAGMLALSRLLGAPIATYTEAEHPVQLAIRGAVAEFAGLPEQALRMGIDGCSVPNFALPLRNLASAFARLARSEDDAVFGDAPRRIYAAMTRHPGLVSGLKRFDLALTHVGAGAWVSKSGAEAVQGVGVRSPGLGIAVKIADGTGRALPVAATEVLRQLELVPDPSSSPLEAFARPRLTNHRDMEVGALHPVFELEQ